MTLIEVRSLTAEQKLKTQSLWNKEYPAKLSFPKVSDFDNYLAELSDQTHFLLTTGSNDILGWGFKFARDSEKWFALIVDNQIKGNGWGTLILNEIKKNESNLNGWVIDHNNDLKPNGEYYKSPLQFYLKNEFICNFDARLENEKLSAVKIEWHFKNISR